MINEIRCFARTNKDSPERCWVFDGKRCVFYCATRFCTSGYTLPELRECSWCKEISPARALAIVRDWPEQFAAMKKQMGIGDDWRIDRVDYGHGDVLKDEIVVRNFAECLPAYLECA